MVCEVKTNTTVLTISTSNIKLSDGPYVLCRATGGIHSVCKLYEDTHHAFVNGILPRTSEKDDFRMLILSTEATAVGSHAQVPSQPQHLKIPVPSRLYSRRSTSKPLAGVSIRPFVTV